MRELSLLPVLQRRVLQCCVARTQENMSVAPRTATPDCDWSLSYAACRADQNSRERVCGSSDSRLRCEHIGFQAWISGVRGLKLVKLNTAFQELLLETRMKLCAFLWMCAGRRAMNGAVLQGD